MSSHTQNALVPKNFSFAFLSGCTFLDPHLNEGIVYGWHHPSDTGDRCVSTGKDGEKQLKSHEVCAARFDREFAPWAREHTKYLKDTMPAIYICCQTSAPTGWWGCQVTNLTDQDEIALQKCNAAKVNWKKAGLCKKVELRQVAISSGKSTPHPASIYELKN